MVEIFDGGEIPPPFPLEPPQRWLMVGRNVDDWLVSVSVDDVLLRIYLYRVP